MATDPLGLIGFGKTASATPPPKFDPLGLIGFGKPQSGTPKTSSAPTIPEKSDVGSFKRQQLKAIINAAAKKHNIDPNMLTAVGLQESNLGSALDSRGLGDSGHGHGIFQLDPSSGAPQAVLDRAASDPAFAANYAASMLASGYKQYGSWRKALSAYNSGSPDSRGTLTNWDGKMLSYADSVFGHYKKIGGNPNALEAKPMLIAKMADRVKRDPLGLASFGAAHTRAKHDPLGLAGFGKPSPSPSPMPTAEPTPAPPQGSAYQPTPHAEPIPYRPLTPGQLAQYAKQHAASEQKFFDTINRTSEAGTSFSARGPRAAWRTLTHGESPQQYHEDTRFQAKKAAAMFTNSDSITDAQYDALPGWLHQVLEGGTQVADDPATYYGGSGLGRKLVEEIGVHALPIASAIGKAGAKLPGVFGAASRSVSDIGGTLHDIITPGGHPAADAIRQMASKDGAAGMRTYQRNYARRGAQAIHEARYTGAFQGLFDKATQGVTKSAFIRITRAIHTGTVAKLPAPLRVVADRLVQIDRAIPYLAGSGALRSLLVKKYGYKLPAELASFDIPAGARARNLVKVSNFRENHVPLTHEFTPEENAAYLERMETGARSKSTKTSVSNPQFKKRGLDPAEQALRHPEVIRDLYSLSFKRAAKQLSGHNLRADLTKAYAPAKDVVVRLPADEAARTKALNHLNEVRMRVKPLLPEEFDRMSPSLQEAFTSPFRETKVTGTVQHYSDVPPEIKQFFTQAEKKGMNADRAHVANAFRGLSDLSRSSLFITPFPHQIRIGSLLLLNSLTRPDTLVRALTNYVRLHAGFASEEQTQKVLGAAREAGGSGVPNLEQSKLVGLLNKARVPTEQWQQSVRTELTKRHVPPGLVTAASKAVPWLAKADIAPKIAAKWFEGVGKSLWGWDDAVKSALFDQNLHEYGDPLIAAYHTQQNLVDYGVTSPLTEGARMVSSFPTWRTKLPVALAKGLAENPHNAILIGRLASYLGIGPGAAYGGTFIAGGKERKLTGSALNEGTQAFTDPQSYSRGALSPTGKLAAMALDAAFSRGGKTNPAWWIYGQSIPSFLLKSLPVVNQAAPMLGYGMFNTTPSDAALFDTLGVETLQPQEEQAYRLKRSYDTQVKKLEKLRARLEADDHISDADRSSREAELDQQAKAANGTYLQHLARIHAGGYSGGPMP